MLNYQRVSFMLRGCPLKKCGCHSWCHSSRDFQMTRSQQCARPNNPPLIWVCLKMGHVSKWLLYSNPQKYSGAEQYNLPQKVLHRMLKEWYILSGITRIRNMMIIQWIHLLSKILLVSAREIQSSPSNLRWKKIITGFEGSIFWGKSEPETMVFTIKYIRCSYIFVPLNQSSGDWYIELVYPLVNVYITMEYHHF